MPGRIHRIGESGATSRTVSKLTSVSPMITTSATIDRAGAKRVRQAVSSRGSREKNTITEIEVTVSRVSSPRPPKVPKVKNSFVTGSSPATA